jgi:tRNA (cmo5U34)-methyltransferase
MARGLYDTRETMVGLAARVAGPAIRRFRPETIQFHFEPESYVQEVSSQLPRYSEMQEALARATDGLEVRAVLDLGTGTGETSAAVLAVHPDARITGIDASADMLSVARRRLPAVSIDELIVSNLQDPLPAQKFDAVVSSLAVHHLSARQKRRLFTRVFAALRPGGRFVLADVVRVSRPEDTVTPISRVYDRPERTSDMERWLEASGFQVKRAWEWNDLVVLCATRSNEKAQQIKATRLAAGPAR